MEFKKERNYKTAPLPFQGLSAYGSKFILLIFIGLSPFLIS